jgi:hypothetical protein
LSARASANTWRATTILTPEPVLHGRNPYFIGIYVMRENDLANFGNTKCLRAGWFRHASFSAGDRRKSRRLHTKLSGVTVIFFPL